MNLSADTCYAALLANDPRFDGAFFVGVSSTGIYCRTVCTARAPRRANCTFYPNAASAERAGYRPCLRCRPELAPGNAQVDAVSRLAARAAGRIEDGALTDGSVADLARELGVSDRHLRRVIERELGVTPLELAQTQRLLLAKRLLTDTDLPVIDIAFASGFSSLRRFNALFVERYRLNPTALRKKRGGVRPQTLRCELAYSPPYDWESILTFLAARATGGVEVVREGRYLRTAAIGNVSGWIAVGPSSRPNCLTVELSASLAPALGTVLTRVKRLFDLSADPSAISAQLGLLAMANPGLRLPGAFDGFEMAVRAILGQQISVKAAATLSGRFAAAFGEPIETPFDGLNRLAPAPARVAQATVDEVASLGIVGARARTIIALAQAVESGDVRLEPGVDVEEMKARLKVLPGIGEWTAQYVAMRALSWPDAFPHTDLGIYKALGETNPKKVLERAEEWRPWRAYAVMHLWKSLEANQER